MIDDEFILLLIFDYLNRNDIFNYLTTNKKLNSLLFKETFWQLILNNRIRETKENPNLNYKRLFRKNSYKDAYIIFDILLIAQNRIDKLKNKNVCQLYNLPKLKIINSKLDNLSPSIGYLINLQN